MSASIMGSDEAEATAGKILASIMGSDQAEAAVGKISATIMVPQSQCSLGDWYDRMDRGETMVSMPPLLSDCFWVTRHDDHERHSWSLSQATQQHVHTNDYTIYVRITSC